MAYDYKETWSSGVTSQQDQITGLWTEAASREITVVCDTVAEANEEGDVYAGLPQISSTHPRLGDAFILTNIGMERSSPVMWIARLDYNTIPTQEGPGMGGGAIIEAVPWARPTTITYSTASTTVQQDWALDGTVGSGTTYGLQPVQTKVGEPYNINVTVSDVQITLKRAFASFDTSAFYQFINTINDRTFLGFPAGVLKINSINATPATFQDIPYFNVTVTILARKPLSNIPVDLTWWIRLYEYGYKHFDGDQSSTNQVRIVSKTKVLLNNNGSKLQPGETPQPWYWKVYEDSNFDQMGFDV